jgi:predicted DNA-binding protein with PD1-like motif
LITLKVPARERHDEVLAVGRVGAAREADLPFFDRKRRALLHLPSDQRVEVLRAGGNLLESQD